MMTPNMMDAAQGVQMHGGGLIVQQPQLHFLEENMHSVEGTICVQW